MPRFVLEIGTEEIPPRFFPPALAQLYADGDTMLKRARLVAPDLPADRYLKVYGTPRRLSLIAEGLAAQQAASTREERGPAARVAFDEDGKPTKAALGFARRHKIAADDLVLRDTDQGKYVFAIVHDPELPAKDALAPLLPELISGISFPKSMRWGSGSLRFARPIRWLLALVDDEVVEFKLAGIHSGRETRGHPVLAEKEEKVFNLAHAADYEQALSDRFVLVDMAARREHIEESLKQISNQQQAIALGRGRDVPIHVLMRDRDLFAHEIATNLALETTFLVEWPTAACGSFDPSFARLPREVLVEEMQHVQSYFPLESPEGELLAKFIAVRDGGSDHLDTVLKGWQSVLRAKLIDADFFYREDLKRPLADRVEDLHGVVFQEKLGTMHEKVVRVRAVAAAAAEQAALGPDEKAALDRAALLCKADLTTAMVTEISDLQGQMGREYALASGEPDAVSNAVGEHYRPRFAGDRIPETKLGRLLAVADKIDTLASLLAVGVTPSGSADPYGLRREAYGIVDILVTAGEPPKGREWFSLSLSSLLAAALEALRAQLQLESPTNEVMTQVTQFLRERLAAHLRGQDIRYDLVDAALAVGIDDISRAEKRAGALRLLQPRDDFLPTVIACTRPINIAKDFEGADVDPDLFAEDAERDLWAAYNKVLDKAGEVNLVELFGLFGTGLRAPIDRFFDDVLVMAEDEKLRRNRLAMCWQLTQLFRRIADFSLVVQA